MTLNYVTVRLTKVGMIMGIIFNHMIWTKVNRHVVHRLIDEIVVVKKK